MRLIRFVVKRLIVGIIITFLVLTSTFFLIRLLPGDPVSAYIGEISVSKEYIQMLRHHWGLDKPLYEQYIIYIKNIVLKGDFGQSIHYGVPVMKLIVERIPLTLLLIGFSIVLALLVGVSVGVYTARNPSGLIDNLISSLCLIGFSMPTFFLGLLLLFFFSYRANLFPMSGVVSLGARQIPYIYDVLWHCILPVFTLGTHYLVRYLRQTRAHMIEALNQDYIITARAKGLKEKTVLYRHALRNALLPIITLGGLSMSRIFSGSVITETIFSWPGLGSLFYEATLMREYHLMSGLFTIICLLVIVTQILVDILYAYADPRISM